MLPREPIPLTLRRADCHADSIRALVVLLRSLLLRPVESKANAEAASQDAHDTLAVRRPARMALNLCRVLHSKEDWP
jgi:hypothetical protein